MLELETVLYDIHEYARQNPSENNFNPNELKSNENQQVDDMSEIVKIPFLRIDQISPNSVAEQADLKVGDQVLQFGSVTAKNFTSLQDISTVFRNTPSGGCINMSIIRGDKFRITCRSYSTPVTLLLYFSN
ncbi:unnamed protein product [Heterobilharzia americana]|nr:unnamed protein product [Heterobilharzia americana]